MQPFLKLDEVAEPPSNEDVRVPLSPHADNELLRDISDALLVAMHSLKFSSETYRMLVVSDRPTH